MSQMKYIVYDNGLFPCPVIFPKSEDHAEFANKLGVRDQVESAGFVELEDGRLQAFGHSHSLGIKSNEGDTLRLNRMLGND